MSRRCCMKRSPPAAPLSTAALARPSESRSRRRSSIPPLLGATAEHNPGIVRFRCALAMSYAHVGERDRAFEHFDAICRAGLDKIPIDWIRTIALAQLIETAAVLAVDDHLGVLRDALSPYSGELIVVATGTQCTRAVDRYLGMAAAKLGETARARALLEAALALEMSVDAPPLVSRTRSWMNALA